MMNKKMIGCCFAALVAVVGCAAADGGTGLPGAPGASGSDGTSGSGGAVGDKGEVGPQGDAGDTGDIACGDVLIKAAEWHSVCGSAVGACEQGQIQCRASLVEGELVLTKVCYGEVVPAMNSGKCNLDADCDGQLDNTVGEGDNVSLVKQAYQVEGFISGSSQSFDATIVKGLCRNAKKHCLESATGTAVYDANGEGVLWSDFGDLHTPTADESKMGFECVNGQDVRTWECTVDPQSHVASLTCTGPKGL